MMKTQIYEYNAVVMLTDAQAYCVTFLICLFRPPLTAAAIYRKTTESKFYTKYMFFFHEKYRVLSI